MCIHMYKYVYAYIIQVYSYTTFWIMMMLITSLFVTLRILSMNLVNRKISPIKLLSLGIATATIAKMFK